jgi:hypothetical protein
VLAGLQEAAQQPILIKRSFILPDELPNLLEIDELASLEAAYSGQASRRSVYTGEA